MADATKFPLLGTDITYFKWTRTDAENPRLAAPIDADDTTITFTAAPKDEDGTVITTPFLMGIKNASSYVETVYCANGADGASGLSATGCIRGIDPAGLDYTAGDSTFADSHEQDSPVKCNIPAVWAHLLASAIQGNVATGGTGLILGTDANGTVTISHSTGAGTENGFLRYNNTTSECEFSDDGSAWTAINDVTASDLVKVSATDTTPSYLATKLVSATGGIDFNTLGGGANETLNLTVDLSEAGITAGTLAGVISDVSATEAEIDQALDGISANVTFTNLNTLMAGTTSDADALHTHTATGTLSLTAGENIDGSTTPQALCQAGENYKGAITVHNDGLNGAFNFLVGGMGDRLFGDLDATTSRAQSFTYTDADAATVKLNRVVVYMKRIAAPTDNLTIEIHSNDTNKPDDTPITNGTSNTVGGATLDTVFESKEFTFATPPTLTSGTKYWLVFKRSAANDAVNYYSVGYENADNYPSHGTSSYTASTVTWTAEATADILFHAELDLDYGNKVFKLDTNNLSRCNFIGFTEDNISADDSVSVIAPGQLQGSFAGLTVSVPYYGTTTAGGVASDPTAPAADVAMIPVGKTRSATQLFTQDGMKYWWKAIDNLDFNASAATLNTDLFIPTGFRPNKIRTAYTKIADGNDSFTYDFTFYDTTNSGGMYVNAMDGTGSIVTAQSNALIGVPGDGAIGTTNNILVTSIEENGFTIRVTQADVGDIFTRIRLYAEGY